MSQLEFLLSGEGLSCLPKTSLEFALFLDKLGQFPNLRNEFHIPSIRTQDYVKKKRVVVKKVTKNQFIYVVIPWGFRQRKLRTM